MSTLLAAILAALPNVFVAIFAKLLTQSFLQSVVERVIIYTLQKAAPLTTNTLDDEIVAEVVKRLREQPGPGV
ncbi:MAG TPA: hypothetical protein VIU93_02590 [Gallionellaceae bacterium]